MASSLIQSCTPATFSPSVFGAEILGLEANLVTNYSASVPEAYRYTAPSVELQDATFCNITVTYTHPGQNDSIVAEAWLPIEWNERFQAVGGGGWVAGRFFLSYNTMRGAIADGFATITTDAGLGSSDGPNPWALLSPGNVNLYNLQNLGSVSLNDEAVIGKSLITSFYGRAPAYSYFNGCSQGGRQGLMLAQRYPTEYDGIAAGAPAIYWDKLFSYIQWPQQVMNELGRFPYGCEIDAINTAAVSACDGLDGVVDGAIADIKQCHFDPFSVVGKSISCKQTNGTEILISETAAFVVNATWVGRVTADGKRVYHAIAPGATLTGSSETIGAQPGLVGTSCTEKGCTGAPSPLGTPWLQLFVAKNPQFELSNLTRAEYDTFAKAGWQQYASLIETADPDLTRFRDAGGKMVTFHGLADNIIPPGATEEYYNAVAGIIPNVKDFYRYFEAPALGHCWGGISGQPNNLFQQLRDWVENGTAPERTPIKLNASDGKVHSRILCPYPQQAQFDASCGDAAVAECWSCSGSDELPISNSTQPN